MGWGMTSWRVLGGIWSRESEGDLEMVDFAVGQASGLCVQEWLM